MFFAFLLVLAVVLSIVGLFGIRKALSVETLRSYHEVSGPMLAIIGTLYAVVLGFIVVDALNSFQKARVLVEQEANALADIFHLANGFPADNRQKAQTLCLDYTNAILNDEWQQMGSGRFSVKAADDMHDLWDEVIQLVPKNSREETLYSTMLNQMGVLSDCRRTRLVTATHVFDPIIWGVLITGGVFTIVFTYFFGL
ncbi:MAG TPA: hypothetical protein V6C72_20105, partial [Chroococcales cyanobacterium]